MFVAGLRGGRRGVHISPRVLAAAVAVAVAVVAAAVAVAATAVAIAGGGGGGGSRGGEAVLFGWRCLWLVLLLLHLLTATRHKQSNKE